MVSNLFQTRYIKIKMVGGKEVGRWVCIKISLIIKRYVDSVCKTHEG